VLYTKQFTQEELCDVTNYLLIYYLFHLFVLIYLILFIYQFVALIVIRIIIVSYRETL